MTNRKEQLLRLIGAKMSKLPTQKLKILRECVKKLNDEDNDLFIILEKTNGEISTKNFKFDEN